MKAGSLVEDGGGSLADGLTVTPGLVSVVLELLPVNVTNIQLGPLLHLPAVLPVDTEILLQPVLHSPPPSALGHRRDPRECPADRPVAVVPVFCQTRLRAVGDQETVLTPDHLTPIPTGVTAAARVTGPPAGEVIHQLTEPHRHHWQELQTTERHEERLAPGLQCDGVPNTVGASSTSRETQSRWQ